MKNNERSKWILTFLLLLLFFSAFAILKPSMKIENKIKLNLELNPASININETKKEHDITIKLTAENPTKSIYAANDYFFRVIINRSYPESPGYIIKEFSKTLAAASDTFEETFSWHENILNNEEFKFRVHFNMYRRDGSKEPILVAASTKLLQIKK